MSFKVFSAVVVLSLLLASMFAPAEAQTDPPEQAQTGDAHRTDFHFVQIVSVVCAAICSIFLVQNVITSSSRGRRALQCFAEGETIINSVGVAAAIIASVIDYLSERKCGREQSCPQFVNYIAPTVTVIASVITISVVITQAYRFCNRPQTNEAEVQRVQAAQALQAAFFTALVSQPPVQQAPVAQAVAPPLPSQQTTQQVQAAQALQAAFFAALASQQPAQQASANQDVGVPPLSRHQSLQQVPASQAAALSPLTTQSVQQVPANQAPVNQAAALAPLSTQQANAVPANQAPVNQAVTLTPLSKTYVPSSSQP